MFAPNPNRLNVNVFAEIEFEDGFIEKYEFPDSSKMNLADKYTYGEKFRKIISEGIRKDENSFMWKDVAKFALRKNREKNFNRIPVKVHLVRAWDEMPDVNVEFRPRNQKYELKNTFRFFTYEVL